MRPAHPIVALAVLLTLATPSAAEDDSPYYGLLPKKETGADRFLKKHGRYDGRGVVVAIFDTGVDPGAPGLTTTTTGAPKVVDMVDGSGSGDVRTTTVRQAKDGKLTGLSGRELRLGNWKNPSGDYHLGLKPGWEIFPSGLRTRMRADRKEKWEEPQRLLRTRLDRELAEWDAAHPEPTAEQLREREDLELRIELCDEMQEKFEDPGPVYDCVVFHDGDVWRAVIDTDEDGDLSDEKAMTNYRAEREFATFDEESLLNFAVNVYDDGNLLSIVADCGGHGTHVAGIVAAHFPEQPELNGIAPGAQIVSVKIGDTRLGSSSVGTGPIRGLVSVLENECDLINMSYGGASPSVNEGRIIELYGEIVNEHGVVFVSTAGNNGPALSSVGSPGGTTAALIGAGAYVSPDMMSAQYSVREDLPESQYTWSSRGPTVDGALGVDVSAPGGAFAPVPNWYLEPVALRNGTSMAAPSICGGLALLLSGLKAEKIPYNPQQVKRAIENTARPVADNDAFAVGRGLLQIPEAYEHLKKHAPYDERGVRFEVSIPSRDNARGLYLRDPVETSRPYEVDVHVEPEFAEDADNRNKVEMEISCRLENSVPWIEAPETLFLVHEGRDFRIKVDPTALPTGAHYAEIEGVDVARPDLGPIFRLPVTVVRGETVGAPGDPRWRETLSFVPGRIHRRFFSVPEGATWADLELRAGGQDTQRFFMVHAIQLLPERSHQASGTRQYIWMDPLEEQVRSFAVEGGATLELCVAQYWSSLGEGTCELELTFHGIEPENRTLLVDSAQPATRVEIRAPIRAERVAPRASLDVLRRTLRPVDSEVRPTGSVRDLLPKGRQVYELILTYEFEMEEPGQVTPRSGMHFDGAMWDTWESMMWTIVDEANRRVATGGGAPDPVELAEGEYRVLFHVRTHEVDVLGKMVDLPFSLDHALEKKITLSVHDEARAGLEGGHEFGARTLDRGAAAAVYVAPPDEFPEMAAAGDLLLGEITYGQAQDDRTGPGYRPDGYPLIVRVPPDVNEKPEIEPAEEEAEESDLEAEILDLQVSHLGRLREDGRVDDFEALAGRLLSSGADTLAILVERLKLADKESEEDDAPVLAAADAILDRIDLVELAAFLGTNQDPEDETNDDHVEEMEKKKAALTEALVAKGNALTDGDDDVAFEENFRELAKWVDVEGDDYVELRAERERRRGRMGSALEIVRDRLKDAPTDRDLHDQLVGLLTDLGWEHWADHARQWIRVRFPEDAPPL